MSRTSSRSARTAARPPEFRSLNPNGKIPAIIDPDGPGGKPLGLFESGAILIYLAEKTGQLLPADPADRYQTIQWVMFQMGGIGPMFGQLGFFNKFAGREWEDKRPLQRYVAEAKRLLGVLETRLDGRDWIMDDYSIADVATLGWVRNLITFYEARELVDFDCLTQRAGLAGTRARPAGGAARAWRFQRGHVELPQPGADRTDYSSAREDDHGANQWLGGSGRRQPEGGCRADPENAERSRRRIGVAVAG